MMNRRPTVARPPRPTASRSYFVYIMSSASRTLYTGVTNNLELRVEQHRSGTPGSFTARYRIRLLVYYETYEDIRQAIAREKEIKGWLRARKIALVDSFNPEWRDLSEEWRSENGRTGDSARNG